MPFIATGIVLALAALGLYFGSKSQRKKLGQMEEAQTYTAKELSELAAEVGKEIGPGSFNQISEIKGTIECGDPLLSELSQTPCVYYSMNVTREYEETYWEQDSNGNQVQRTRRGSESVASNRRSLPFLVRDATGTILVEPDGASFVDEKVFSQFEQGARSGSPYSFGRFSFDASPFMAAGGRRTIGFRFEESAIPVGRAVYVLGEVIDRNSRLRMAKPDQKGKSFIVSLKSEEEMKKGAQAGAKGLSIASLVLAILGIAVLAFGIFRGA
jgi:hypothetical protein